MLVQHAAPAVDLDRLALEVAVATADLRYLPRGVDRFGRSLLELRHAAVVRRLDRASPAAI